MIIISVEFATSPDAKSEYTEAPPEWKSTVKEALNQIISNPSFGAVAVPLMSAHPLNRDEPYKSNEARAVDLSIKDRFVYKVLTVKDPTHFLKLYRSNKLHSVFKMQSPKINSKSFMSDLRSGKFGYIVIVEVGGHYKLDKTDKINHASATKDLSWLEAAFAPDNLSG